MMVGSALFALILRPAAYVLVTVRAAGNRTMLDADAAHARRLIIFHWPTM